MADLLPHDLIMEVLLLLRVKSLLRFRCVCKSWYGIIGSRDFIYSHLDKSSINRQHYNLIEVDLRIYRQHYNLIEVDLRGSDTNRAIVRALDLNNGIQKHFMLDFEIPKLYPYYVAYCNGLVLFRTDNKFSVWNPSTRHYRKLPDLYQSCIRRHIFSFGFGYDATTDDYMIVVICFPLLGASSCEVWIYALKTSCWRIISDFPSRVCYIVCAENTFVDGCVHFLCAKDQWGPDIIMAFDVAKKTFHSVSLPMYKDRGWPTCFQVFEGCLSIRFFKEDTADMYVRKKDEVGFSWTKLFSLTAQQSSLFGLNAKQFNKSFTTLGYSKEGDKILLVFCGKIYSYDLKQARLQVLEWSLSHLFNHMYCVESLVSISS